MLVNNGIFKVGGGWVGRRPLGQTTTASIAPVLTIPEA